MNILKIENLKKVYGSGETEVKALDEINIVTFNCRDRKANKWKSVFL